MTTNNYKLGQILSDEQICSELGLTIPNIDGLNRKQATQVIANFQIKKAYAVASLNTALRSSGIQLAQKSHTNFKVVSVAQKAATIGKIARTMCNAAQRF